jgi:hypothetical protein
VFEPSERMRLQYLDQLVPVTELRHAKCHVLQGDPARFISVRLDSADTALPERFIDDNEGNLAEALLCIVKHLVRGNPHLWLLIGKLLLIGAFAIGIAALLLVDAAAFGDGFAAHLCAPKLFKFDAHLRALVPG